MTQPLSPPVTLFMCGPNRKCEHDYSDYQDIVEDGKIIGWTVLCVKCGQTAYEEDQWR